MECLVRSSNQPAVPSQTAAPSNAYPTSDDQWVLIAANSEPLFARLTSLMHRSDLINNPCFKDNPSRVRHCAQLDSLIGEWTRKHAASALISMLELNDIPCSMAVHGRRLRN